MRWVSGSRSNEHSLVLPGSGSDCRLQQGGRPAGPAATACYLMACGLIGEPVPPVIMSGGPQKKNS